MFRLIRTLALVPMACAVLAAPAPKSGWEKPIDPDRDCKIEIKDDTVTMELPGGNHDFDPKRKHFNAPRLLREVEGDFVVQVRVSGSFRPPAKPSVDARELRVAAGLLIVISDKDYMRLDYTAYRLKGDRPPKKTEKGPQKEKMERKGDLHKRPTFQIQGSMIMEMEMEPPWELDPNAKEEHIYLLYERRGEGYREAISLDGKTWTTHTYCTGLANLPRKFKVGLAAYSTSTEPFKVRFDQFKLIRGGEKSK